MPPHAKHHPSLIALPGRDELLDALSPIVPDVRDRTFILRCMLDEGPPHHRIANHALLLVLARLVSGAGASLPSDVRATSIAMRLPPHLQGAVSHAAAFPLGLPRRLLDECFDREHVGAVVDALTDGPPQHALANAAILWFLEALAGPAEPPRLESEPA